jgi:type IV secretion system protein VirB2
MKSFRVHIVGHRSWLSRHGTTNLSWCGTCGATPPLNAVAAMKTRYARRARAPANSECPDLNTSFPIKPNREVAVHTVKQPRSFRPASIAAVALLLTLPGIAAAQTSPFLTGASALQTNILAWLTPIAVILIMVLGAMAMANRMSWGWCIGAILGIAIAFGAPQIVTWVRGMFGV